MRRTVGSSAPTTGRGPAPKPQLPPPLRATLVELLRDDVAELERITGRSFGWL